MKINYSKRFKAEEKMNLTKLSHSFQREIIDFKLEQKREMQNKCDPPTVSNPINFETQYHQLQS